MKELILTWILDFYKRRVIILREISGSMVIVLNASKQGLNKIGYPGTGGYITSTWTFRQLVTRVCLKSGAFVQSTSLPVEKPESNAK